MQHTVKITFPIIAVSLILLAVIVSVYPFGSYVEKPYITRTTYSDIFARSSILIDEKISVETLYKTFLRTEMAVVTQTFLNLKPVGRFKVQHNLADLEPGDVVTIETGPQIDVSVIDSAGVVVATSDKGILSFKVSDAGLHKVWFKTEGLDEGVEAFIGVTKPKTTSVTTQKHYKTDRVVTTTIQFYAVTKSYTSPINTYKTVFEAIPVSQKLWTVIPLISVAIALAAISLLLWVFKVK